MPHAPGTTPSTQELEPLQARLEAATREAAQATETVRSWERDQVPLALEALDRAVSALISPPMGDMARLSELAPLAMRSRVLRVGPALINPANMNTPHATYTAVVLRGFMAASGLLSVLEGFWLSQLKRKVDPQTYANVERVMTVDAEYLESLRPNPPVPARDIDADALSRAGAVAQVGGPAQLEILPAYDSVEGARQRAAGQPGRYRGPIDWPSYNGLRTPYGN